MADRLEDRYADQRRDREATALSIRTPEMPQEGPGDIDEMVDGTRVEKRGSSATITFNPGMARTSKADSSDHAANLAEDLSQGEQATLVSTIEDQVKADLESRADWQRRIDQAMELLGLRNTPLDDLPFEGASAVTYPLIGEACVQFQARAIEEVFPSEGPAKTKLIGEKTKEKEEQAERVKAHMNFQMVDQDRAYFWNTDQMLFWLPVGGSAFKKTYYDPLSDMVVSRLVHAGDFIVPYIATDLRTAPRYTHRLYRTDNDLKRLMASEFYSNVPLSQPGAPTDTEAMEMAQEMRDEADDRQMSMHDQDFVYEIYEMHCDLELEVDQDKLEGLAKEIGLPLPYIVTINKTDQTLLSIRRNWRENDDLFEKRMWFTHYKYLPGLGFYGFGLLHLIGSVAEASTGTIRALLDAAAFANLQGGFMSDEAKVTPEDAHLAPGVWKQVKMSSEELKNAFYTPPFKEPSPALAQLFKELTDVGRRFASITEEMTGDAPNTGPVGTTIALIEQGSKVFSGVHRRLHTSQAEEFSLRAELNFEFLDEEYPYEIEGQDMLVLKSDYDGRVDVIPVSDPNIFSSTQRIAQAQAMMELAERFPHKFDLDKALERFLKAIKVPDYEELLTGLKATKRKDAVAENMEMLTGGGTKAFVEQDHDAHIQVHMAFLGEMNDDAMPVVGPAMQSHLAEHYALKYYNQMNEQMGGQMPPPFFMDENQEEELPVEIEMAISQMAAQIPPQKLMPPSQPAEGEDEHQAKMRRDQEEFDAEEKRKKIAFDADQQRKDEEADNQSDRDLMATLTEEGRKEESHVQDIRRTRLEGDAKRGAK